MEIPTMIDASNGLTSIPPQDLRTLVVGAALFAIGTIGFLTRRNLILLILCAELMLHGVSLSLVTFGKLQNNNEGQAFTIFLLTIAACEAGLALALVLSLYRSARSLDIRLWTELRETDVPVAPLEPAAPAAGSSYGDIPRLTPAGTQPAHVPRRPAAKK
ncbi:MAG: NADH-quinone oxidoreductase subunit NuoK [Planctomycetaceae bacterium]|jgi:NADH-quinone oxidoreductase subunit K